MEATPDEHIKEDRKRLGINILIILVLVLGLILILYPTISYRFNKHFQSRAIADYTKATLDIDWHEREKILEPAKEYNENLVDMGISRFLMTDEERKNYESILNVSGTGILGYVEIPDVDVYLPIYHGTSQEVLQIAAGHLEGTSLPIGGPSTHACITGHTGLPSAQLFDNIDKLQIGDTFRVIVLDEVLTYKIDKITKVLPEDVKPLRIEEGQDLCTLMTCTPYGINSHRLMIRGHRVETPHTAQPLSRAEAEAEEIGTGFELTTPLMIVIVVVLTVGYILHTMRIRRRKKIE